MVRNFINILLLIFLSACVRVDSSDKVEALSVITKFCAAEFQGIRDIRIELAVYDKVREKELEVLDPQLKGRVIFWDGDPIMVVSTFTVVDVNLNNTTGTALVEYRLIMDTAGDGVINRIFNKNCSRRHTVTYSLIRKKNKWFVHNPPIPHISLGALMKYYSLEINSMPKDILTEKYTPRKMAFERLKDNLVFLEKISRNSDYCP